jgi:hypothetical protein
MNSKRQKRIPENLAPWTQPPALAQLFGAAATTQMERTGSIDDPIASAIIDSLRFELGNAEEMVKYLQQELQKERSDSDE